MRQPSRRDYTDQEIYQMSKLSPRRRALQSVARAAIVIGLRRFDENRHPADHYSRDGWARDENFVALTRASVSPAMTSQAGWAAELAHVSQALLATLTPMSAGAALLERCLQLSFNRAKQIIFPTIAPGSATFIAEGAGFPVTALATSAPASLLPAKMGVIIELTREMMESSNAESVVTQVLIDSSATGLDAVLFSNAAAVVDTSPAGLLHGVTPITASTNGIPFEAMCDDLCKLVDAIAARAGNGSVVFVASPAQAMRVGLQVENSPPIFGTTALANGTVVCIATNSLVSALEPPTIDTAVYVSQHEDTVPSASPSAGPRRSTFQTDSVALRLKMPVSWTVRDPAAVSFVTATEW